MTHGRLQTLVDTVRATSPQRWLLCLFGVSAPIVASASITVGTEGFSSGAGALLCLLAGLAISAAGYPDSHTGLTIIGVIAWQWIATVDDVTSFRSLLVALCLLAMHSAFAVMAVTPHMAVIERAVLTRTARRAAAVSGVTTLVWLLVIVFDRRDVSGSTLFSFLALSLLVTGVVALRELGDRHRSLIES